MPRLRCVPHDERAAHSSFPSSCPIKATTTIYCVGGRRRAPSSYFFMERPPEVTGESAASAPRVAAVPSDLWLAGKAKVPDSGWERLQLLYRRDEFNQYPEEFVYIVRAALAAGIIGCIYGGIPGFKYAKKRYIEQSEGEIYHNRLDAVQCAHRAGTRGFIRYGWRWGWRVAAFVTIFNTVNIGLNAYYNENAMSHFVVAGAVTGGLFRVQLGLRGLVAGSIIGALFGLPAGGLLMAMQNLAGETLIDRRNREQREKYEKSLSEWRSSVDITENISEK
uniref:Complex I assembly factor TIMMDC1, mitochondrial n=1 Tax=Salvator merianae TaxID=96440 RepID=A0A8D0B582_SALMN